MRDGLDAILPELRIDRKRERFVRPIFCCDEVAAPMRERGETRFEVQRRRVLNTTPL